MKTNKFNIYPILQHLLFVASLITIALLFDPRPDFVKQGNTWQEQYHFLKMMIMLLFCFYLNLFFLVPKILTKVGWIFYLLTILVVSVVIVLIIAAFMPTPIGYSQRPVAPQAIIFLLLVVFSVSTSISLNNDRIKQERRRKERENESLKSELSLLRSQITPHFMFNVLNTLTSLARQKSDNLEDVVIRLSHLMRYMLYSNSDKKINIDQEVEFLNSYMEIQKLRFGELDITTTIDVINPEIRIVPMLLIPLLENAYKHGTGTVEEPQIKIVLATSSSGVLQFTVTNRFNIASNASTEPKGIGLQNVRKRLGYLYEDKHELTIFEDGDVFTTNLTLKL